MIAQDTGSAIVGPARADLYFGAGVDAGKVAGRLKHNMRFVMLVPKSLDPSVRGRKMPVPDARPSEKIAKLFPQVDPLKDQPKDSQEQRGLAGARPPRRGRAKVDRAGRRRKTGAAAGARGPTSSRLLKRGVTVTSAAIATVHETPDIRARSPKSAAAAAQARPERGRARAVGERCQTGQAAAQADRVR